MASAQGSGPPSQPGSATRRPPRVAWTIVLPVVSIVLSLFVWYETRQELAKLSQSHAQLQTDFDTARGRTTIDVAGAPALGPADQVVTLVEFSDYECPFCLRHFTQTMPQIETQYIKTGRIRYVFKDFPIDELHPAAIRAHEAARCAAEQGKFWQMHARLFSRAGSHDDAGIEARATEAGLSVPSLRECLASGRATAGVRQSVELAKSLGANGTPSFFVGLRDPATDEVRLLTAVTGAQPFSVFEQAIAAAAARAR
ncbi:MAG: DsbA family protein [Acidobacteria bacterium]|nr:DsbA family protein [Acidobacteriota bacterium]